TRLAADTEAKMKKDLATRNSEIAEAEKLREEKVLGFRKLADDTGAELTKEKEKTSKLQADLTNLKKERDKLEKQLAKVNTELTATKSAFDEAKARLNTLLEKTGTDPRAVEAETFDAKASAALKTWKNDWKVVRRTGARAYINLGSADGVVPQLTFSVHSRGMDGRLSATAEGTVEVVRVTGEHLSLVQITSERDPRGNPIIGGTNGDRLFNPTWDPKAKKSVAVAGIVDLAGDGKDGTAEFLRLLAR